MNSMTGLDTNILVYACDKSEPVRQAKAMNLVSASTDGIMLWQVACEFVAASRKLNDQGFTAEHAWNRLAEYLAIFPLILPTPAVLEQARQLHLGKGVSFWDATILAACMEAGVTRFYSEDLPGQQVESIEIVNPFV
jgi:predicted nucleic acid-binding protein